MSKNSNLAYKNDAIKLCIDLTIFGIMINNIAR